MKYKTFLTASIGIIFSITSITTLAGVSHGGSNGRNIFASHSYAHSAQAHAGMNLGHNSSRNNTLGQHTTLSNNFTISHTPITSNGSGFSQHSTTVTNIETGNSVAHYASSNQDPAHNIHEHQRTTVVNANGNSYSTKKQSYVGNLGSGVPTNGISHSTYATYDNTSGNKLFHMKNTTLSTAGTTYPVTSAAHTSSSMKYNYATGTRQDYSKGTTITKGSKTPTIEHTPIHLTSN